MEVERCMQVGPWLPLCDAVRPQMQASRRLRRLPSAPVRLYRGCIEHQQLMLGLVPTGGKGRTGTGDTDARGRTEWQRTRCAVMC